MMFKRKQLELYFSVSSLFFLFYSLHFYFYFLFLLLCSNLLGVSGYVSVLSKCIGPISNAAFLGN